MTATGRGHPTWGYVLLAAKDIFEDAFLRGDAVVLIQLLHAPPYGVGVVGVGMVFLV